MELLRFLSLLSGIQAKDITGPGTLTGPEHEPLSFCCEYDTSYSKKVIYWCRGQSFSSCDTVVSSSDQRNERTSINDSGERFCITIKNLRVEDSGPYWCAVQRKRAYERVSDVISIAVKPVTQSKPSTASPTTQAATEFSSPSMGSTILTLSTLPSTTNRLTQIPPGSGKLGTLTILGISVGFLLFLLCLAGLIATICRRTRSRAAPESQGDNLKDYAEPTEIFYADVTVNKRSHPLCDIAVYDNMFFHTTAENPPPEGSVVYASVKQ